MDVMVTPRKASDLPSDQAERVLAAMRKLLAERGSKAALARDLGITPSAVGQLLSVPPKNAPSHKTAELVAKLLGTEAHLLLAGIPAPANETAALPDRYPNRAAAVPIARRGGVDPEAIEIVLSLELDADEDPPELWWIDRMRNEEHLLKVRRRGGAIGTPVESDQATPPRRRRS